MSSDERPGSDLQALFDDAACGLLQTDTDGTIREVNTTFCSWIGRSASELIGQRKVQDLLTMGGRIFHQTHWAPLLQIQGSVAEVKLEVSHRDGQALPMVMNAVRIERDGTARHHLAVFGAKDRHQYEHELLLARRRAEELLQELARQRALAEDRAVFAEQMIGIVSHDLRNPLSAIQMSAHLLARSDPTANQLRVLGRITHSASRADRLIADLLDFTQARVGDGLKVTPKPIDLHGLMADSIEELAAAFPDRVLSHQRAGEGSCRADADRLVQLTGNLVANAMVHGDVEAPVTVTSRVETDRFVIDVHNQGEPIPPALQARLFEPLARGHDVGTAGRSIGLGLFIVREIVRAHGGSVGVQSTPEAGTSFTAEFPR